MSDALQPLLLDGVIDQVIGQLKAGKEAEVWLVEHAGQVVAAKVYKERHTRSFKNNAGYTEGRQVRSSRTQRAIDKGSKFGQAAAEEAWKAAEADALYKLHAQGVRVPTPVMFYEGVLLMELVLGPDGAPAPRLVDAPPASADDARAQYLDLRQHIIGMLSVDLIHGDLSPYNILASARGPVIIDFPQTIAAARNNRAESYFARDLENVRHFFLRFDPRLHEFAGDAADIWSAYLRRELSPDYVPSGRRTERRAAQPAPARGGHEHGARPERQHAGAPGAHAARGGAHAAPVTHGGRGAHGSPPAHAGRAHGGAHPAPPARSSHAPRAAAPPLDPAEAELLALQEQILKQGGGERGRPFAAPEVQAHRGGKRRGGFRPGPPGGGRSGPAQHARPAHHGGGQPAQANRQGGGRPAPAGAPRPPQQGGARPAQNAGASHPAQGGRPSQGAGRGQPRHGGTRPEQHGGTHHESHGGERQHRPQNGRGPAAAHGGRSPSHGSGPPPASHGGGRPATTHGGGRPAATHGGPASPAGAHRSSSPGGAGPAHRGPGPRSPSGPRRNGPPAAPVVVKGHVRPPGAGRP